MREALVLIGHGLAPGHQLGVLERSTTSCSSSPASRIPVSSEGFAHGGHDAAARFRHVGIVKLLLPVFGAGATRRQIRPSPGSAVPPGKATTPSGRCPGGRSRWSQTVVAVAHEDDGGRLAHRAPGDSSLPSSHQLSAAARMNSGSRRGAEWPRCGVRASCGP